MRALVVTSLIWLAVLAAMVGGAYLRGWSVDVIWPYAAIAAVPALISLVLAPATDRDWAQIIIILGWLALAITACLAIAFNPMAILFLCVPAIAALFAREKVVEALIIAALAAAAVFFAGRYGYLPDAIAGEGQAAWGRRAAIMGALSFMIAALFGAAGGRVSDPLGSVTTGGKGVEAQTSDKWLNAVPGSTLRLGRSGGVNFVSDEARTMLGLPDHANMINATGLFPRDLDTQADFKALIKRARDTGHRQSLSVRTGGEETHAFLKLVATPDQDGDVLVHITDMTDVEARLDTLRAANRDARQETEGKNLFFAGVSHELRTPLNAIIGFSDMMRSRLFGPLPNKYAEYADLIHDSGQHMLDLIGDVLDLSKVDAGKYELNYDTFDAADVIRSSIKMTRPAADSGAIELDADIHNGDELLIEADRKAVRQILLNLLSNAIKFTPKGGRVIVGARAEGDLLSLWVSDNGSGMNPEDLARVGEPYQQAASSNLTDERGSGLGLTLVKSLTELHKGRFAITSTLGEGTQVNIYLPLERMG